MNNPSTRSILLVAAMGAGLALGACATHDDVAEAVGAEGARAQQAEAQLGERITSTDQVAHDAVARADAATAAAKHPYQYQVLLQDDAVKFATNSAKLTPEGENRLAEIAAKLQSDDRNVYIEIQGHGDSRGTVAHNRALGQRRADAVREFLAGKGVPLIRMTTISYGEEKPANPANTPDAHTENRRVVLIVMG